MDYVTQPCLFQVWSIVRMLMQATKFDDARPIFSHSEDISCVKF